MEIRPRSMSPALINCPALAALAVDTPGIDLALLDPDGRARAAAVNNTYPGREMQTGRGERLGCVGF